MPGLGPSLNEEEIILDEEYLSSLDFYVGGRSPVKNIRIESFLHKT